MGRKRYTAHSHLTIITITSQHYRNTLLNLDFKEFIQSLNANAVRYLVIGGYAVAYHGHPRYTKDIDIWIEMSQDNAERMIQALTDFG